MPKANFSPLPCNAPESGSSFLYRTIGKVIRHPLLDLKAKAKIIMRIVGKPAHVVRLEKAIDQLGLGFISDRYPRLFEKPSRPYLACGLSSGEKVDFLCEHFKALSDHFDRQSIESIYNSQQPILSSFLPEMEAEVVLHYEEFMEKEGELTLSLLLRGVRVYSLTCLLNSRALYIGSLQGSKSSLEEIRRFTKISHGLRPQNFVVFLARIIAQHFGLPAILAIRNESHIYSAKNKTQERIRFDYDSFWSETGGTAADASFYSLPLAYPRKEYADIPMNKRAQYRRRYEFLDACAASLASQLDRLAPQTPAVG